jgi:arginyl-tRNA synthetase
MKIKKAIIDLISNSFLELNLPKFEISLDHPINDTFGDYASNVAMLLYPKVMDQYPSPHALADHIVTKINELTALPSNRQIANVSVAGPGFINFTLDQSYLLEEALQLNQLQDSTNINQLLKDQKICVEYTDPNPFKEFHVGHLYSNIVGESISRIFEANRATVWRADYFGDVGMHVAKSIWGLLQKFSKENTNLDILSKKMLNERIKFLGQAYALGASAYETTDLAKEDIKDLNYIVYLVSQRFLKETHGRDPMVNYQQYIFGNKYDPDQIFSIYKTCRNWSLDYFETIYKRLGTKFDGYYPESVAGEYGYQIVQDHLKDVFETGDKGAIIFPGKKYGLHDRVFINALGLPTYECKELALPQLKFTDSPYDKSYIVTGNEINDYFQVLLKAISLINPQLGKKTTHLGHGMVRLPEGKMSSRTGQVITGESLLDEAYKAAIKIIDESNPNLSNKNEVADQVALAAIKYTLLKSSIGQNVVFSFKEAVSFNGNSGPYLQYTFARCHSVLEKSGLQNSLSTVDCSLFTELNPEELSILKWTYRFPEVVAQAATELAPHLICTYLYELAQRYNTFYNKHTILGSTSHPINELTSQLRLLLTASTAQILKNGLHILGIKAPNKM